MRMPYHLLSGVDRKKLKNIGWMTSLQVVTLVSGLVLMTVMARHLGPSGLAAYAWLFSLVTLAAPLTSAMDPISIRMLVENADDRSSILRSTFAIHLAGAVLGVVFVLIAATLGGPTGATPGLAIAAGLLLLGYWLAGVDTWFRAQEMIVLVAVPKAIGQVAGAILAVAMAMAGAGVAGFVWLRSGQTVASSLASVSLFHKRVGLGEIGALNLFGAMPARMLKEGWPLIFSGLASVALLRIDQVMLGWMAPEIELANYSLAARLAEILLVIPGVLHSAFYPSLVQANHKDAAGFEEHMQRYFDLHGLAGWLGALGLALGAWLLFVPVFGTAYSGGVAMLMILALVIPVQLLVVSRDTMLSIRRKTRTILFFSLIGIGMNISANLILIPFFGGQGAALATVASVILVALATLLDRELGSTFRRLAWALVPWDAAARIAKLARNG